MRMKSSSDRYGSVAIILHWLTAATIAGLFVLGFRAAMMDDPASKTALLRVHVPLGVFVLAMTVLRIGWRFIDRTPDPVRQQDRLQAVAARGVHTLLYVIVVVMGASGVGMLVLSGAGPILFGGAPGSLPNFVNLAPHMPHVIGAFAMLALLTLHVSAALYHQFIRRDRLLARMGIGGRLPDPDDHDLRVGQGGRSLG